MGDYPKTAFILKFLMCVHVQFNILYSSIYNISSFSYSKLVPDRNYVWPEGYVFISHFDTGYWERNHYGSYRTTKNSLFL